MGRMFSIGGLAIGGHHLRFVALCGMAAGALACSGKGPGAERSEAKAEPEARAHTGQMAPDFEVSDEAGNRVRLSDHRGKRPVLLAFYPKDFTSG